MGLLVMDAYMLPENSSFKDEVKNYLRNYMLFNIFFQNLKCIIIL